MNKLANIAERQAETSELPPEIATNFYPWGVESHEDLGGGIVNNTFCVTDSNGEKSILQRLNGLFSPLMSEDFEVVTGHLCNEGWEVPRALMAAGGDTFIKDRTGSWWRAFSYIESDEEAPLPSPTACTDLAGLLGNLHKSLVSLKYNPCFAIPNFHDTAYYTKRLEFLLPQLPSAAKKLGKSCIAFCQEKPIPAGQEQLIHGDPKLANALYRRGKPFTFIDFDTVMRASPLVDVGDLLRSAVGKLNGGQSDKDIDVEPIIESYYETRKPNYPRKKFLKIAREAGQLIAMELAARFLIDIEEQSYFAWDKRQYESSQEYLLAKALAQFATYESLSH